MDFKLRIKKFKNKEALMAFVHSEENMKPVNEYIAHVHHECTTGLSEENKKLYFDWHSGKFRPSSEEQIQISKDNPELYGSIMQSISMGLG